MVAPEVAVPDQICFMTRPLRPDNQVKREVIPMYVAVDEEGRIGATTEYEEYASEDMIEFDFPEDFDFNTQNEYKIQNGELVHDPLPPSEEEIEMQNAMLRSQQIQFAVPMMVQAYSTEITDRQAVQIPLLFKKWTVGETYKLKEIVRYPVDNELYRIGQPEITALNIYKPGAVGTESIYSHIKIDEGGYEYWKEWDGITGLYKEGDIVRDPDDEQLYISTIPNNTYGPPHAMPQYWDPYTE